VAEYLDLEELYQLLGFDSCGDVMLLKQDSHILWFVWLVIQFSVPADKDQINSATEIPKKDSSLKITWNYLLLEYEKGGGGEKCEKTELIKEKNERQFAAI